MKNLIISIYASTSITSRSDEGRRHISTQHSLLSNKQQPKSENPQIRRTFIDGMDGIDQGVVSGKVMVVSEDVGSQLPIIPRV